MFKDEHLTAKYISPAEFESGDDEFGALAFRIQIELGKFNELNLKRLSLSSFFRGSFYLCDDKVYDFYGKPIIKLTIYQTDLFQWGMYFKHKLSESKLSIPDDLYEKPDELIEYIDTAQNAAKILDGDNRKNKKHKIGEATSLVGATKEDYQKLKINPAEMIDPAKLEGKSVVEIAQIMGW